MQEKKSYWQPRFTIIALEFVTLFAFWLIFSENYTLPYLIIGIFCTALVTWLTHDIIFYVKRTDVRTPSSRMVILSLLRVFTYVPWLLWEIIKANLLVAAIILHPKLPINPSLVKFKTGYKNSVTKVTLANSITLTPGTITVNLDGNSYTVHALTPGSASSIINASMLNRVGIVFEESCENPPAIKQIKSREESSE